MYIRPQHKSCKTFLIDSSLILNNQMTIRLILLHVLKDLFYATTKGFKIQ